MKTGLLRSRKGMTTIELMVSVALLSMVLLCTLAIMDNLCRYWQKGVSGTNANMYASLAIRKMVQDIQEGKSAALSGDDLAVTFPYYNTSTHTYIRTQTGDIATYYLSGPNGTEESGYYLWKSVGANKTLLAKNVQSLTFTVTGTTLVIIRLTGRDQEGGAATPNLIQTSIKLRNG